MNMITVDFSKTLGKIKPMNAVNNGPVPGNVRNPEHSSMDIFKKASIPYARNHDASFYGPYGGEHIVDVHRIFKNFDADENDPASYWFEPTDEYLKNTIDSGVKVFYRLGASIEHYFKYGTVPPKDFEKWARICEHIIMHYNEGWANGFEYDIEYWEIWNEPDCRNADGSNPCWQGTEEEFIDLYEVAAKHLKSRFPHLKIGGPAFTSPWPTDFKRKFLNAVKERNIPFDFYSYHWYGKHIKDFADTLEVAQEELELAGLSGTLTNLNEWNYVRGWLSDDWNYSLKTEKNHKGASFVAAAMCAAQAGPLDMLMYYDARPCTMNGIFDINTFEKLKPFYAFKLFSRLLSAGEYVPSENPLDDIWMCAAKGEEKSGIMLTYYNDNDDNYHKDMEVPESSKTVTFEITNPYPGREVIVRYYLTNESKDDEIIKEENLSGDIITSGFDISLFDIYYIEIEKLSR